MVEENKQSEQLIILGNGFDLRCGLKSSYADFYEHRYGSQEYKDKIEYLCTKEIEKFKEVSFSLNIWDIILCERENVRKAYWKDIEEIIKKYVLKNFQSIKKEISLALSGEDNQRMINDIHNEDKIFVSHAAGKDKVIASYGQEEFFKLFDENFDVDNFYIFLMSELKKFENEFSIYLSQELANSEVYNNQTTEVLRELITAEVLRELITESFSTKIISFNYTWPFEKVPSSSLNRSHYRLKDYNIEIKRIQNVHGILEHEIVFGIDRNVENQNLPDYTIPFTKTYRSLSIRQPHHEIPLFSEGTKIIKFYGHSLGDMDYTYFKVIFDDVDLVNGNVQLIFFFSLYDKHIGENGIKTKDNTPEEDSQIREENYKRIDNLIRRYEDETLEDKISDILLHKLVLEGRLLLLEEGLDWKVKEEN